MKRKFLLNFHSKNLIENIRTFYKLFKSGSTFIKRKRKRLIYACFKRNKTFLYFFLTLSNIVEKVGYCRFTMASSVSKFIYIEIYVHIQGGRKKSSSIYVPLAT